MQEITDKFTNHLKNVLTRALCLVVEQGGETIRPVHLLWSLGTQEGCVGAEVLAKSGINAEALRSLVGAPVTEEREGHTLAEHATPLLSDDAKQAIEKAVLTASMYEHRYVGTEHLLSGLIQLGREDVRRFFHDHGVRESALTGTLTTVFKTTASFPDVLKTEHETESEHEGDEHDPNCKECADADKTPALDFFTVELTTKEAAERIDPLVGREREVARLAHVLLRRTKNNPLLIGDPGVGKTAIVEGLAKAIVEGRVPDALRNKRILRLDLSSLVAGTMYRGDFENRVEQVLDEVRERPDVVLFIDEIHTIVGAGSASGSLDAANMLKPALARGEIRCIGATTPAEYKKHIEADGALERRFQAIVVREPTLDETRTIINGLRPNYERFHGVRFTDEAVETALTAADRYLHGKQFPDKAVDILDEAGAAAALKSTTARHNERLRQVEDALRLIRLEKTAAVFDERFADALQCKTREAALLEEHAALLAEHPKGPVRTIGADDILAAVAHMTGIPVSSLSVDEKAMLASLDTAIARRVVGQPDATRRVASSLRRARMGLARRNRPLASFLFVGPSGVGKTELARAIAATLFNDPSALIRLDMSEFSEGYAVSRLLGSPAGYVGYREGAKLADPVRARPHAVVLFDEFEKAHPDVHNLLLQLLDEGVVTDATGRSVSFAHTVVIMTTNAGRERFTQSGLGFDAQGGIDDPRFRDDIRQLLEEHFRPELLNRIDHTCLFRPLATEDFAAVAAIALAELRSRLAERGITLDVGSNVAAAVARAVDAKLGARDVRRVIEARIEHPLTDLLLSGPASSRYRVDCAKGDIITVRPAKRSGSSRQRTKTHARR
ncbi:ATP-dependent Clp protease ATP-binding subunit [Candidatus Uhrbacteria bacterium]|nr:ATP-dependent Clp protease ATP-binding subunit [Candidatus Uhrbacteria bacterium]